MAGFWELLGLLFLFWIILGAVIELLKGIWNFLTSPYRDDEPEEEFTIVRIFFWRD